VDTRSVFDVVPFVALYVARNPCVGAGAGTYEIDHWKMVCWLRANRWKRA
jgi:hypothetical protein